MLGMLASAVIGLAAVEGGAAEKQYYSDLEPVEKLVGTDVKGQALFWLSENGKRIRYKVTLENAELVRAAHVHLGKAASNFDGEHIHLPMEAASGPIIFHLVSHQPAGINVDGLLAEGEIAAGDLTGPLWGGPLSALIEHFNMGYAYVVIHVSEKLKSGNLRCCPAGLRGEVWFR
jgi:hypothetical protein